MLDFRMNTFIEVCRQMSYTKAAEVLSITQPAVSQHIRYIEGFYQIKLFAFQGKKMSLTRPGELLLNAVTTMKHDDIYLKEKLEALKHQTQALNFGVTLTIGEFTIPAPLASYLKRYPSTSIRMTVANTRQLLDKISSGEIDFALVEGYFAKNEYDSLSYSTENYLAVCGPDYRFRNTPARLEDLLSERLIVRESGSGTREILEKCLAEKNLMIQDFRHIVEIGNLTALKTLLAENLGVSFLYETAVRKELEEGTLLEIKLNDFGCTHDFTFIWRKDSIFAEHYKDLFRHLHQDLPS